MRKVSLMLFFTLFLGSSIFAQNVPSFAGAYVSESEGMSVVLWKCVVVGHYRGIGSVIGGQMYEFEFDAPFQFDDGYLAMRIRDREQFIFREPNGNLLLVDGRLFGGSSQAVRLRCGADLVGQQQQQVAQRHVHTHTPQATMGTNVLGAVTATFNVTTRNHSQSSTDAIVQANAYAALLAEAVRRFPNLTDVTITNVARQNSDSWMEGAFVVLSVNYVATGQAWGIAGQSHTHVPQAAGERLGTVQSRFVSGNVYSEFSGFRVNPSRVREQAGVELRMAANNRFEGNIEVRNITIHFVRNVWVDGTENFEHIAEGVVYRIR